MNPHLKIDLKKRRRDLGLSQQDLANKLHVSVNTIQNWENRKNNYDKTLLPYAKAIKLDPMEIIDPYGSYEHISDMYKRNDIDSINNIEKICFDLKGQQISNVYNFVKMQLADQNNVKITHEDLKAKYGKYDLKITMLVHENSEVEFLNNNNDFFQKFNGKIPKTYSQCMQFKTNKVMSFGYDQIVFLRPAHVDLMYSGVIVIAQKMDSLGKMVAKVFKFRYVHKTTYLIPLTSQSSQKDEDELGTKENKYIWRDNDGWEVTKLINQPSF
ncbi:XRE family transcriptional regulator [Apilactobacillus micheneri]|uniref:XRE family transcriptional regulator n=1 Tax=Apilactobacillus micheneri TaxID=1899430 RepID=A0ABY2YUZ6_9LACO|nr:helix-turn-helix transcriptional regulator [Apilactobacillus micheneri]TPR23117.1 XRE family transcriptional regulator [Apilactobacillus micheneri]TPR24435.1 XRE family transcriptional regulator [Apilactobacillus micheneri]TPR29382.1 XRE family transcriptional regulator [Apilactobacillus micheneri]TPR34589.1 XRE family transcriptional regulator [Apilactobacillus micheneri]